VTFTYQSDQQIEEIAGAVITRMIANKSYPNGPGDWVLFSYQIPSVLNMNRTGPRVDPELVASPPAMAWYCGDGTNGDELYLLKIIERDGARDAICARFAATPLTQVSGSVWYAGSISLSCNRCRTRKVAAEGLSDKPEGSSGPCGGGPRNPG